MKGDRPADQPPGERRDNDGERVSLAGGIRERKIREIIAKQQIHGPSHLVLGRVGKHGRDTDAWFESETLFGVVATLHQQPTIAPEDRTVRDYLQGRVLLTAVALQVQDRLQELAGRRDDPVSVVAILVGPNFVEIHHVR